MPNNSSVIGVNIEEAEVKDIAFIWEFPHVEEDI